MDGKSVAGLATARLPRPPGHALHRPTQRPTFLMVFRWWKAFLASICSLQGREEQHRKRAQHGGRWAAAGGGWRRRRRRSLMLAPAAAASICQLAAHLGSTFTGRRGLPGRRGPPCKWHAANAGAFSSQRVTSRSGQSQDGHTAGQGPQRRLTLGVLAAAFIPETPCVSLLVGSSRV